MGSVPFTRGQIYKILSNPIYIGEIHHRGKVYGGQHEAIVTRELWDEVQATLAHNRQGEQRASTSQSPSLLAGRIVDAAGEPLVASHARKGHVRYRCYVSKALQHTPKTSSSGCRIPALELEKAVCEGIADEIQQPLALIDKAGLNPSPAERARLARSA